MKQAFYAVKETAEILGLTRTATYNLVKKGALRSVRIEGALRVPASAIPEFVASVDVRPDAQVSLAS